MNDRVKKQIADDILAEAGRAAVDVALKDLKQRCNQLFGQASLPADLRDQVKALFDEARDGCASIIASKQRETHPQSKGQIRWGLPGWGQPEMKDRAPARTGPAREQQRVVPSMLDHVQSPLNTALERALKAQDHSWARQAFSPLATPASQKAFGAANPQAGQPPESKDWGYPGNYGGATTLADAAAYVQAQGRAEQQDELVGMLESVSANILADATIADKGEAIAAAAGELSGLMASIKARKPGPAPIRWGFHPTQAAK